MMEKKVTISAKTMEEALRKAVRELGAPDENAIAVTVLEEPTKGFFGLGAKEAKIEAVYKVGNEFYALQLVKNVEVYGDEKSLALIKEQHPETLIY